jgi:TonB family protein
MQVSYVTATPVRKIRPAIPASLRGAINGVVSVSVKVMIDASGKVVSAAPVDTNTAAQKMLAPEAVQAARLWSFEPARRDGQPVSSESVLKFDFERQ